MERPVCTVQDREDIVSSYAGAEEQEVGTNAPRTIKVSRPAPERTCNALSRSALEESALQSSIKLRNRVMQKLTGNDHGDTTSSSTVQSPGVPSKNPQHLSLYNESVALPTTHGIILMGPNQTTKVRFL